ncbi:MAG: UDP-N-acetylmuramoyl-L-alanyl-D-glutamate--2,6-diaminopimelate ligase [Herbaspirillum sp.]|jgi:UDP-N-acetylmuramoyl-L-alanyl-D-glutamate--2,6-diaminopimelate ligase|nr:UDP-N-acetylmuramoyl-L-alanyl-D-glutamate--2,6-diaminopimelate ligase [Herbaspirillum sp.]
MTPFALPPLPPASSSDASMPHRAVVLKWLKQIVTSAPASVAPQLCADSRRVQPGDIFFAFPGDSADGRSYIADAVERGARAVVFEADSFAWDDSVELPHLGVSGLKQLSGSIANAYYNAPDRDMFSVAVTGTNGKTSCAYWLANALSQQKPISSAAMIGTLGIGRFTNGLPGRFDATGYTTPDAILLQRELAQLRTARVAAVALEASSIGMMEGRLNGMHVDVALFTNLTRDHLDYHGDMAAYGAAKVMLFDRPELQHGVVNLDDAFGVQLAQRLQQRSIPVLGYSIGDAALDGVPVLRASALRLGGAGTVFQAASPFGSGQIRSRLVGQFNVSNLLGVLGVLLVKGVTWEAAVAAAAGLSAAPGRMQQLGGQDAPLIVIDYAHTPDAMQKTLAELREIADQRRGKLWCVFGCGGDRDSGKRPEMGRASEAADEVILTSDNPRSEEPQAIIEQIRQGMQTLTPRILEDRAAAILWAVRHAGKQDVVLLAGKGHEMYQEASGKKLPFLDADHASLALAARATMMGGA